MEYIKLETDGICIYIYIENNRLDRYIITINNLLLSPTKTI